MRWLTLTLVLFAGCEPDSEPPVYVHGSPHLDFGPVPFNQTASGSLMVHASRGTWRLEGAQASGAALRFAPFLPEPALFDVAARAGQLTVSAPLVVAARCDPEAVGRETDLRAALTLSFVEEGGERQELPLTFTAHVLPFTCVAPPTLDFGPVVLGEASSRTVRIENPRDVEDLVWLTGLSTETFRGPSTRAVLTAPRAALEATFTFTPLRVGPQVASVSLRRSSVCPQVNLMLEGEGLEPIGTLSTTPEVQVGGMGELRVTLANRSNRAITVNALSVSSPEFSAPPPPLVVPSASVDGGVSSPGFLELPILFTPTQPGRSSAHLVLQLDHPKQGTLSLLLQGIATP